MTVVRLEDAFLDERIGSLLDGDWRRLARGWADVMEDFTHELTEPARRLVLERNIREVPLLSPGAEQHLKGLFDGQGAWAIKRLRDPKASANDWKTLHNSLRNDADSIGHRLAALAVAAWVDPMVRRAVEQAAEALPGAVSHLEAATKERNTVIHRRTHAEDVDVQGFRDRILRLVGAWMISGLRA
jgi:hypothetical protein